MDCSRAPFVPGVRILSSRRSSGISSSNAIAIRFFTLFSPSPAALGCSSQARVLALRARISNPSWRGVCASAEPGIRHGGISPGLIPSQIDISPDEVSSNNLGGEEEEGESLLSGESIKHVPRSYSNKFIRWVKLGSVINDAAMAFFKSEVRRRTFITIILLMVCRAGQFVPLPGFNHRTMPSNFLGSTALTASEGAFLKEPKISFFHLGLSPYICASTVIHLVCSWYPPFQKMRKEGEIDKIKSYTWWLTLSCSVIQALLLSYATLQYATASDLSGSMLLEWISRRITESGFGQGSTLIICMGILVSSSQSLCNMVISFSRLDFSKWGPALLLYVGVFLTMTACAVLVTEGRRIIKLQFYGFDRFPSSGGDGIPEVEPYIPFDINPNGMLPVYMSSYLMAVPSFLANILKTPFLRRLQVLLNPTLPPAPGARPWLYHTLTALLILTFSVLDVSDGAKDISEYINRIGAKIADVKPGRSTVEFLRKVQTSARTWGGFLLALLVTVSTIIDYKLRSLHQTGGISFTSMLFIVGTIIEVRRSFMAYHAMHTLSNVLRRYGV
ncbi:preprotein translocase subunit SCY2, chloroplastic [Selaginella moellendorffii]|uniref:preprotein translocase subunit SCY2, chloroplastic n=1 Tax=Selaginella moellendorffii TaxID=88036 RepID=UPI000D1C2FF1|nr:preprotein translocase subunit SCY2, chloroplastic [Selaginella moellendorffii]|eukprot:XP_024532551.1 preprotein translocase subunit SCY2, chloroplastic [Selaginella moellendorffii]